MRGILPKWEYGSFTLIIAADESPARVVALDHTRRLALPLAVQASPKELSSDEQVARAMAGGIARMSFKLKDKKFAPVSSWLGKSKEEDINGYRCTVHDLSGVCVTRLVEKTPLGVPVANGPGDMPYEVRWRRTRAGDAPPEVLGDAFVWGGTMRRRWHEPVLPI